MVDQTCRASEWEQSETPRKEPTMKRLLTIVIATTVAAVPAVLGLAGNASFAQSVPVRVPAQAQLVDDHGGATKHAEPGDDNGGATKHAEPGDDNGGATEHPEPGDDNGGATKHAEPGDDNGGATATSTPKASDDQSGRSGGTGGGSGGG